MSFFATRCLSTYPLASFCLPVPEVPHELYYFEFRGSLVRASLQPSDSRFRHISMRNQGMYNEYQLPVLRHLFKGGVHSRKYGIYLFIFLYIFSFIFCIYFYFYFLYLIFILIFCILFLFLLFVFYFYFYFYFLLLSCFVLLVLTFCIDFLDDWARPIFGLVANVKKVSREDREKQDYSNMSKFRRRVR